MAVEYVLAFVFTVSVGIGFGTTVGPAVESYRASLHEELLENRALIQELENVCAVPAT